MEIDGGDKIPETVALYLACELGTGPVIPVEDSSNDNIHEEYDDRPTEEVEPFRKHLSRAFKDTKEVFFLNLRDHGGDPRMLHQVCW